MPNPDPFYLRQSCSHLTDSGIQHDLFNLVAGLPQIDQLIEYFTLILCVSINPVILANLTCSAWNLLIFSLGNRFSDDRSPFFQFRWCQKIFYDNIAVLLVEFDLRWSDFSIHSFEIF